MCAAVRPAPGRLRSNTSSDGEQSVSIIITARNYGRFLAEAIESALRQSVPCEVIYSDDCSTDDSVEIARRYERHGVIVITTPRHLGVCLARNRGVAASTGAYLVHLDGDDVLTPDFVEKHLAAMDAGVPFVYGPALAFGEGPEVGILWKVPLWEKADPWQRNTVNTSAMYARWAFDAAGGWCESPGTMWDWHLALRAARFGVPRPSSALLLYRQHGGSWSRQSGERSAAYRDIRPMIRRELARLSVGMVVSGRLPGLFHTWFERVVNAVREMDLSRKPDVTILDNCRNDDASRHLRDVTAHFADDFAAVRVIPHPTTYTWASERERRDGVASFMAHAHNRLRALMGGDIHWIVEDDILVNRCAGRKLLAEVTGERFPNGVSGCYRSRHGDGNWVAGWRTNRGWELLETPGNESIAVDYTGTGCLMYWKDRTPRIWESHTPDGVAAHDWAWGLNVKRAGGLLLLMPTVRCAHAVSESVSV